VNGTKRIGVGFTLAACNAICGIFAADAKYGIVQVRRGSWATATRNGRAAHRQYGAAADIL